MLPLSQLKVTVTALSAEIVKVHMEDALTQAPEKPPTVLPNSGSAMSVTKEPET